MNNTISDFSIKLERDLYFPGQVVNGKVSIQNEKEISCKSLKIKLVGKGTSYFRNDIKAGNIYETQSHLYTISKHMIWGVVADSSSVPVDSLGVAEFGTFSSPDEGIIRLVINNDIHVVALKIKELNSSGLDSITIGERKIHLHENDDEMFKDVSFEDKSGSYSTAVAKISVSWEHDQLYTSQFAYISGTRNKCCLKINVKKIAGLEKSRSSFVYIEAISESPHQQETTEEVKSKLSIFPPSSISVPFQFQLPSDLPSTFYIDHQNHISYSLYAYFDVGNKLNYSCRKFFTLIRPSAVACYMRPISREIRIPINPLVFIPLCCVPYGEIIISANLSQTGFIPGDIIHLNIKSEVLQKKIESKVSATIEKINVYLNRLVHLTAGHAIQDVTSCIANNLNNKSNYNSEVIEIKVPITPPTYEGGIGKRNGIDDYDPIICRYELLLELFIKRNVTKKFIIKFPIVICSIGLHILPEFSTEEFWQQQGHHSPARPSSQVLYKAEDTKLPDSPMKSILKSSDELVSPLVDWTEVKQITSELLEKLLQSKYDSHGEGTIIKDPVEDFSVNDLSLLMHNPVYFTSD